MSHPSRTGQVMGILERYRSALRLQHGWEVDLTCRECGHSGLPRYEGWEPNGAINLGNAPTMFARVSCASCERDLRSVAGEKLVAMFSDQAIPATNKRMIFCFVLAVVFLVTLIPVAQFVFETRFQFAWIGFLLVLPLTMAFNFRVASMRRRCPCGKPKYVFMGMLGRTYCYRCSTCGNCLRLRD